MIQWRVMSDISGRQPTGRGIRQDDVADILV